MTVRFAGFPLALAALLLLTAFSSQALAGEVTGSYDETSITKEAEEFFGAGAEGLAEAVARTFKERGDPNAYIKGEEAGGAIGVGLRYGQGTLHMRDGSTRHVYWQGPSIGWDVGGNAAKTFVLIYRLDDVEKLYQRFPGVEGSAYLVGGVGVNYNQSGDIVLAPIRFGVGLRLGASVGYMKMTKEATVNPF